MNFSKVNSCVFRVLQKNRFSKNFFINNSKPEMEQNELLFKLAAAHRPSPCMHSKHGGKQYNTTLCLSV